MQIQDNSNDINRLEELFQRISNIKTSSGIGGIRAPHKYLLLLFAIGQCLKGKDRMIPYEQVDNALSPLLARYAPYQYEKNPNSRDPFWRLQNDGFWELEKAGYENIDTKKVPAKGELVKMHGGLTKEDYELFSQNPYIALSVAQEILDLRFAGSLHQQILDTTGIEEGLSVADYNEPNINDKFRWIKRRWRDPKFSKEVIYAYENQCAICQFSIRKGEKTIGLEAAHIKWHQYKGPAKVSNGLALCAMHHELFDAGAFTITPETYKISVSDQFSGHGDDEILGRYNSATLPILPNEKHDYPDHQYLRWHIKNIYHGEDPSSLS